MATEDDEMDERSERVPLNLRVHQKIKTVFDDELIERFGRVRPYGGTEFEREVRAYVEQGDAGTISDGEEAVADDIGALRDAVETVADTLDVEAREKERSERPTHKSNEETEIVRYHVHEDVRVALSQKADEDDRTEGELAGQLMWSYAVSGGIAGKIEEKIDAVEDELTTRETATSTAEAIAERLDAPFRREEFLDAAAAAGVTTEKYALREYLPDVLEELDVYPHPGDPDRFIERDSEQIPATPDPGTLPYHAMSDADRRIALKAAALRAVKDAPGEKAAFTVSDAADALGGHPRHSTVRPLLKEIAEASDDDNAFNYDSDLPGLRVYGPHVRADEYRHEDALAIVGWLDEPTDEPTDEATGEAADDVQDDDAGDEWIDRAAESVEEFAAEAGMSLEEISEDVLNNKIAAARHPGRLWDDGTVPSELVKRVSDDDRERVRDRLEGDVDTQPPGEDDADTPPSDERAVGDRLDALTDAATPAREAHTDGGDPSTDD